MAQNINNLNVASLDFSETKASLKSFLESQNTLKDYNFDGSVLSTILDVLAYNTHYQGFYANMVSNEMFLDTALLRPSIASHAKQLGYVPQSHRASKSTLTVPITGGSVTSNTYLARGTEFLGKDGNGDSYKFILLDNVYANTNTNRFEDVNIYEGSLRRITYIYDRNRKDGNLLLIPNDKIDTTTIRVRVQASVTDTSGATDVWSEASTYINLTSTSKVFFLQEKERGMYELYFGDGFLGVQPSTGNVVSIEYLETSGSVANGISSFTSTVQYLGTPTSVSTSSGGGEPESSSKIKFIAPKYYKSQSRAVTQEDYKTVILKEYTEAGSVYVYGGEDIDPPQYGKVFIAIKPKSGSAVSTADKSSLTAKLKSTYSVVGIIPEIVDTEYTDLIIDTKITYDPSSLSISSGTLKAIAVAYAFSYSNSQLNSFGSNFYYSQFTEGLNNLHNSILSNQTKIRMRKTVNVKSILSSRGLSVDFRNALYHPHDGHGVSVISSNPFPHKNYDGETIYSCSLKDDGYGILNVIKTDDNGNETLVYPNVGSVDYDLGKVTMNPTFYPVVSADVVYAIIITAEPRNQDLFVSENKILRVSRGYADSVNVALEPRMGTV